MTAAAYKIEVNDGTAWYPMTGEVSRSEARGYLWAVKDGSTPRLAYRVVRVADGKVVDGLAAVDTVDVGQSAGSPPAEQLLGAALRTLDRAAVARAVEPDAVIKLWQQVGHQALSTLDRAAVARTKAGVP